MSDSNESAKENQSLSNIVSEIDKLVESWRVHEMSVVNVEVQEKHLLFSPENVLRKIADMQDAEVTDRRLTTDYYVLPTGDNRPTFSSEFLRLRDINRQEVPGKKLDGEKLITKLTYQTSGSENDDGSKTRLGKTVELSFDDAFTVLRYLTMQNIPLRRIIKERIIFRYKDLLLAIDQDIQYTDSPDEPDTSMGSYLEITYNAGNTDMVAELLDYLEVSTPANQSPYADVEHFVEHSSSMGQSSQSSETPTEELVEYSFVDYDSTTNQLSNSLSWQRLLGDNDIAKEIAESVEKQQAVLGNIRGWLQVVADYFTNNHEADIRESLPDVLENAKGLDVLAGIDSFASYPRPKGMLREYGAIKIEGMDIPEIDSSAEIVMSVARTKTNKIVFMPHRIFAPSLGDDTVGKWAKRRKRA